ncbi:MAG: redoxin domain-containing protein [Flavobacteriaceae bacterium]|nr:MAG: redoxin domain-containing protein [Flavobacteriaceae bacterium]
MRKILALFIISIYLISCKKKVSEIPMLSYEELKPILHVQDDKIYVINFWATWCAPCVKELPYFEKLNETYKNVEVVLVSLDFPDKITTKLIPFVKKHELKSRVVVLNDTNEQFWIHNIDEKWSGAIPATLIYNKDNSTFYEQSFTYETLENKIQPFIK